jgi:hypothetical protein
MRQPPEKLETARSSSASLNPSPMSSVAARERTV